jgi:hypothetical protein
VIGGCEFRRRWVYLFKDPFKTLNTLATRAFDYAIIINRNDDIIISSEALQD